MTISLNTASGGMDAFQQMLDVVGNNIANENTTAYKSSTAEFSDILSQTINQGSSPAGNSGIGGINAAQVGLGVQVASIYNDFTQGPLEQTGNPNDLAIAGSGFFTVSDKQSNGSNFYTRAGDFSKDANGNLVTPNGYYLMGAQFPLTGTTTQFPLSGTFTFPTGATSTVRNSLNAVNLDQTNTSISDSGAAISYTAAGSSTPSTLTIGTATGDYTNITLVGGMLVTGSTAGQYGMEGSVTEIIATTVSGTTQTIQLSPDTSVAFGGSPLAATDHTISTLTQGSFTVSPEGVLTVDGGYTYYLPLANFNNPSGLIKDGNNLYSYGSNSGSPVYSQADPSQNQSISQGFLEGSNVDLTKEMSNMIVAQTGYEANSKVISTVNSMNQFMIQNV